jgi:preprotein translocase subunit SecG
MTRSASYIRQRIGAEARIALQAIGLARENEMLNVVIVIHLMIVLAMIGVVLLQKSEGGGLGMGGGGAGGFLSSRGTANVLTRTTAFLALGFFVTSLVLSILAGYERKPRSIIQDTGSAPAPAQAPGAPPPLNLPDALRGGGQPAPPAEGGAPQVPRSQ